MEILLGYMSKTNILLNWKNPKEMDEFLDVYGHPKLN